MDSIVVLIRRVVSGLLERIRKLVTGGKDVSPIFRELVRNGGFERPVIERNYWSRKFVPAMDGWSEVVGTHHSHLRSDGRGAYGSSQYAWLAQNAITQDLDTSGLAGGTLDVSLHIAGQITVTLGRSHHSWRAKDVPDVAGGWRYVSFRHTVAAGEAPSLQLRVQGDSPKAVDAGTGLEIVHDHVDNVSVRAWRREIVVPEPMYSQVPGLASPVVIYREP